MKIQKLIRSSICCVANMKLYLLLIALTVSIELAAADKWYNEDYLNYLLIDDHQALTLLRHGMEDLTWIFGPVPYSSNAVELRSTQPYDASTHPVLAFPHVRMSNEEGDRVIIFLTMVSNEPNFHGQLAHELFHLVDPRIKDVYMEGLATLFAEKLITKSRENWERWRIWYQDGNAPFYGQTYFMMKNIENVVGWATLKKLPNCKQAYDSYSKELDINRWLADLNSHQREEVRKIILRYADGIRAAIETDNQYFGFIMPAE